MTGPRFCVVLTDGSPAPAAHAVFGPFADRAEAGRFAAFITRETGPAEVRALMSPVAELLAWRDTIVKGDPGVHPF